MGAQSIDREHIWRNVLFYLGPFRLSPTLTNATGLVKTSHANLFQEQDASFSYLRSCSRRKSKPKKLRHRRRGQRHAEKGSSSCSDSAQLSSSDGGRLSAKYSDYCESFYSESSISELAQIKE